MIPLLLGILSGVLVLAAGVAAMPEGTPMWVVIAMFVGDKIYLWVKHFRKKGAPHEIGKLSGKIDQANTAIGENKEAIDDNRKMIRTHTDEEMKELKAVRSDVGELKTSVGYLGKRLDEIRDTFKLVPKTADPDD